MGDPGPGQLVTRTRITGVSTGTETRVYRGKQVGAEFPLIPGYENLGEVVETGPGATLAAGQRVFVRSHEYDPAPYTKSWGSQVSHSLTSEQSVVPVPDDVPDEQAIYAKVAGISLHGIRRARVREGEWVVVVGLGIIGHLVVQHAVALGARVVAIDLEESRLRLAADAGAEHTLAGGSTDIQEQVHALTTGGANVAFDATGLAQTLEATSSYLRPRPWDEPLDHCPRLVLQGTVEDPVRLDYFSLFKPEVDLITPRDCDTRDIVDSLSLMASGSIRPELIPHSLYSYREAQEAYDRLVDREIMRVLFTWD